MSQTGRRPLLELRQIAKGFPGVQALSDVSLEVYPGEVHCLLGENGAGKSTLIKILTGAYERDSGQILWEGQEVRHWDTAAALERGVAAIYQELSLIPQLSVAENIFLGREPRRYGLVDWPAIRREAARLMGELELGAAPDTPVGQLGMGHQQMVEIAKALSRDARVLIMDEPTSSLSDNEISHLKQVVKALRDRGVAIIYISHKLDEVKELGDRITVLRDGRKVGSGLVSELTEDQMVSLMVGRQLTAKFPKAAVPPGAPVLTVKGLRAGSAVKEVSFTVRAGEVVGLFGLVGAGRTEMARAVFGADPKDAGTVEIDGQPVQIRSPVDAIHAGIAFLTENRKQEGLVLGLDLMLNSTLTSLDRFTRRGWLDVRSQRERARELVTALKVRPPMIQRAARDLSGGNQQKVVLAKWLCREARVFIFDEPTRGIDVGAKVEVYQLMNDLVARGAAILMISSELPEILGMSDRILVMREGRLVREFTRDEASQERILRAATGGSEVA